MFPTTSLLVTLFILLLFSALFSASEASLIALNKVRLRHLMEKKQRGARRVWGLVTHMDRLIATILIGNSLVKENLGYRVKTRIRRYLSEVRDNYIVKNNLALSRFSE